MTEFAARQDAMQREGDLEMSDVRLLDGDEDDDTMPFGQSNLTSVLANPDFGRRRLRDRALDFLQERPHPLFNVPSAGPAASAGPAGRTDALSGVAIDLTSPADSVHDDSTMSHDYKGRPRMLSSQQGMVAADQGDCSALGVTILAQGGNAVDSAITTALCQGIMSPAASGLGGGHFMVIRSPNGTTEVIDAREVAPAAATETMFKGNPKAAVNWGLAIAVPLELKGLWLAHQRHGRMAWADLVHPVVPLAAQGFPLHPYLADEIGDGEWLKPYPDLYKTFMIAEPSGYRPPQVNVTYRPPRVNESCCARPRLAAILRAIALLGPDVFYTGQAGQALAEEIQAAGGIVTAQDLAQAQPSIKQPITVKVWGYDLIVPPPPSSAAIIMLALHILSEFPAPFAGANGLGSHHLVEAMKSAFALRMQLGDPGPNNTFQDLDVVLYNIGSMRFASQLQREISDNSTQNFTAYGGEYAQSFSPDDHGTSHLSVVDSEQGAVAMTTTINTGFGSKVVSASTGLILNNQMDDFSTPDQANVYGLAPSAPNFIRPGKKPLSSMSPSLLQDSQGRLVGVVGASGGPRILTAVLQTLIRLMAFGADPLQAVAEPRLHHQLLPDFVGAEHWNVSNTAGPSFMVSNAEVEGLRAHGHVVDLGRWGAVTQAIVVDPNHGTLVGASDPRKDGAPAGY